MTLSISFYNNIKYTKDDFLHRDSDFFGNGVVNPATSQFPITYNSNMTVNIGAGVAWVDGYRIANDSNAVTITVPAADATNPRIDIVQLGHDDVNSTYSLMVKKGVAAATPTEPGADTNYIKLYAINVAANATAISSANVTDRRALLPLNVDGSQIVQGGNATTGANTFSGTQTAPTFVATSATAPLQLPPLTQVPSQTAPSGTLCIVNGVWYESNGSAWNPLSVPWSAVTGAPTDYAKTDAAQTFSAAQTFGAGMTLSSGQTFTNNGTISGGTINASSVPWSGVSSKPTTVSGYGIAGDSPTWTGTHTFNNTITGSITGSAGSVPWSGVSSKPTTVSGYGISGDSPTWTGTHTFNNAINGSVTGSAGAVPWSGVTGKPNVAAYDTAQTWTAVQTWASNQTFAWNALTGVPTDLAKTDTAQTFSAAQTFSSTVTLNGTVNGTKVGAANGLATLDGTGNVPKSQLGNVPPSNLLTMPNAWIG